MATRSNQPSRAVSRPRSAEPGNGSPEVEDTSPPQPTGAPAGGRAQKPRTGNQVLAEIVLELIDVLEQSEMVSPGAFVETEEELVAILRGRR